jgi:hypothetical protein
MIAGKFPGRWGPARGSFFRGYSAGMVAFFVDGVFRFKKEPWSVFCQNGVNACFHGACLPLHDRHLEPRFLRAVLSVVRLVAVIQSAPARKSQLRQFLPAKSQRIHSL